MSWAKRLATVVSWLVVGVLLLIGLAVALPDRLNDDLEAASDIALIALVWLLGVDLGRYWHQRRKKRRGLRRLKDAYLDGARRENELRADGWSKWADGMWTHSGRPKDRLTFDQAWDEHQLRDDPRAAALDDPCAPHPYYDGGPVTPMSDAEAREDEAFYRRRRDAGC